MGCASAGGRAAGCGATAALIALLAFAAALRWLQWSRAVTLFNDGPEYLAIAQAIAAGDWSSALASPHHPLYPLLVAGLHGLGVGWENAGAAVGAAGGTAAVAFLFLFVRDAFGAPAAWIAAGLFAVHARAVEFSSDVQSDGLYLGLFLAAVWASWRAWARGSARWAAIAGLAAGLAYLTRPEGIGIACVAIGLALAEALRRSWPVAAALRWSAAVAALVALCVLPYAAAMHTESGQWALTRKKSVGQLAGVAPRPVAAAPRPAAGAPPLVAPLAIPPRGVLERGEDGLAVDRARPGAARAAAATRMLARTGKSTFRYGMLLLLVPGLVAARGRPSRRALFVAAIVLAYAAVLWALTYRMGYVSRRHALPPLAPLFGYVGLGALAIGGWIAARTGGRIRAAVAAAALAAAIGVGEAITQREPRRAEDRAARAAAEWLRDHAAPGPLAARRLRLGYYAGMPYVPLGSIDAASLVAYLDAAAARYVLVDEPEQIEAAQRAAGPGLRALHRVQEGGREAWIFERVAPSGAAEP